MRRSIALSGQVPNLADDVIVAIEPRLIGLEVAELVYNISATKIAELQDAGEMPVVRIGKRRLVPVAAVDAWIEQLVAQAAERAA